MKLCRRNCLKAVDSGASRKSQNQGFVRTGFIQTAYPVRLDFSLPETVTKVRSAQFQHKPHIGSAGVGETQMCMSRSRQQGLARRSSSHSAIIRLKFWTEFDPN